MSLPPRFPFRIAVVMPLAAVSAVAASMVAGFAPIPASAQAATYACANKAAVTRLSYPLSHMAQRIAAGAGASGPAASYPNRLEAELKARGAGDHRPQPGRQRRRRGGYAGTL